MENIMFTSWFLAITIAIFIPTILLAIFKRDKEWIVISLVVFTVFIVVSLVWGAKTAILLSKKISVTGSIFYFMIPLILVLIMPFWHIYSVANGLMWKRENNYEISFLGESIELGICKK